MVRRFQFLVLLCQVFVLHKLYIPRILVWLPDMRYDWLRIDMSCTALLLAAILDKACLGVFFLFLYFSFPVIFLSICQWVISVAICCCFIRMPYQLVLLTDSYTSFGQK